MFFSTVDGLCSYSERFSLTRVFSENLYCQTGCLTHDIYTYVSIWSNHGHVFLVNLIFATLLNPLPSLFLPPPPSSLLPGLLNSQGWPPVSNIYIISFLPLSPGEIISLQVELQITSVFNFRELTNQSGVSGTKQIGVHLESIRVAYIWSQSEWRTS